MKSIKKTSTVAYIVTNLYLISYKKNLIYFYFSDPPYIDRRPEFTKLAFARGAPATLICRASGFPEVDFTWFIKRGRPDDKMEKGQLISKEIFVNSSKMNAIFFQKLH